MDFVRAIILGLIQALTEFLPISSSAHLILFREWLGLESVDGLTFDVALHVGTLLALIVYFRRDLRFLVAGAAASFGRPVSKSDPAQRLAWMLIVGTVPAVVLGIAFNNLIENAFRNPSVIVVTLTAGAVVFVIVERVCKPVGGIERVTFKSALVIGVAQGLALIPGVSRAGITTAAGMTQNLVRAEAARFSFLLGIPVMIGASAKKAFDVGQLHLGAHEIGVLAVGTLTSAIAGWLVIGLLLKFFQKHRLDAFAVYRVLLAIVVFYFTL